MKQGSMTHFLLGGSNKQQWFMVNLSGNKTQAADVYWRLGLYWFGKLSWKIIGEKFHFVEVWGGFRLCRRRAYRLTGRSTGICWLRQILRVRNFPTGFLGANAFWADEFFQCLRVAQDPVMGVINPTPLSGMRRLVSYKDGPRIQL